MDITDKTPKEIEYQHYYEIVSKFDRFKIPKTLVINLDQTPSLMVPVRKHTMTLKGSKHVLLVPLTKETSQPHFKSPYQEISYKSN